MELASGKFFGSFQLWETNPSALATSGCKRRIFTLQEVALHVSSGDCWVIIYDRIYDLTEFIEEHPGGWEILLEYAGKDATLAFRDTGHSKLAVEMLEKYPIGDLSATERIFRKATGFKVTDIPK